MFLDLNHGFDSLVESMLIITVMSGFEKEAKEEIKKIIPHAQVQPLFFKGCLLVKGLSNTETVLSQLGSTTTSYIAHIYPIQKKIVISGTRDSFPPINNAIRDLNGLGKEESFSVRCKRRGQHDFTSKDLENYLGTMLKKATGATVNLRDPSKTVIVEIFQNLAYLGITETQKILRKRILVSRKYAVGKRPFTRAEHKIREALVSFGLEIKANYSILDLGSSPGGWVKILSSLAKRVLAVDPADLDLEVSQLPNVTHFKCKAEELPKNIGKFDLITNDMNLNPKESARIMVGVSHNLKKDGAAIMTVKFVTHKRRKHIDNAIKTLENRYGNFVVKHLPHNRFETTIFMRKLDQNSIAG